MNHPLIAKPFARPQVHIDQILTLSESEITVRLELREDSPAFQGHFPEYGIFPGVFSVELVRQAGREFCARYFPNSKLVHVAARFVSPILPGDTVICQCLRKHGQDQRLSLFGTCSVGATQRAVVKLRYIQEGGHGT